MNETNERLFRLSKSIECNQDGLPEFPERRIDSPELLEQPLDSESIPYNHTGFITHPDGRGGIRAELELPDEDHQLNYQGDDFYLK